MQNTSDQANLTKQMDGLDASLAFGTMPASHWEQGGAGAGGHANPNVTFTLVNYDPRWNDQFMLPTGFFENAHSFNTNPLIFNLDSESPYEADASSNELPYVCGTVGPGLSELHSNLSNGDLQSYGGQMPEWDLPFPTELNIPGLAGTMLYNQQQVSHAPTMPLGFEDSGFINALENTNLVEHPAPFISSPLVHQAAAATVVAQSSCTQCFKAFTRDSDRIRHESAVHGINRPLYLCSVQGCLKSIGAGYTRKDKLTEHMWKKHANLGFTKRA